MYIWRWLLYCGCCFSWFFEDDLADFYFFFERDCDCKSDDDCIMQLYYLTVILPFAIANSVDSMEDKCICKFRWLYCVWESFDFRKKNKPFSLCCVWTLCISQISVTIESLGSSYVFICGSFYIGFLWLDVSCFLVSA